MAATATLPVGDRDSTVTCQRLHGLAAQNAVVNGERHHSFSWTWAMQPMRSRKAKNGGQPPREQPTA